MKSIFLTIVVAFLFSIATAAAYTGSKPGPCDGCEGGNHTCCVTKEGYTYYDKGFY